MYEIVFDVPLSNQNPGAAPVFSIRVYCIFISCHLCPPKFLYVADPMDRDVLVDIVYNPENDKMQYLQN